MAVSKSNFIKLTETRVFQIPVQHSMFTVILWYGETQGSSLNPILILPVHGPIMLCQLPASAWHTLWPEKQQPPGWLSVTALHDSIELMPNLSQNIMGGVVAYYAPDPRVPVNGKAQITWFNKNTGARVPYNKTVQWNHLLQNTTPPLPFPLVLTENIQSVAVSEPTMLLPSSSADLEPAQDYLGGFIGTGVGVAIIMAMVIWFTAKFKST